MKTQLIEEAIKSHPDLHPEVIINAVSKRVRQLNNGARPMVRLEGRYSLTDIALTELIGGMIGCRTPVDEFDDGIENPSRKGRRKK
ncbi:MAG: DNA-directed RNA polymerase subunit omega [Verrucomicrobiae bacterium]|nr:DNA-directed RNA polymerase subunit omega [Verrucomicrobiae bacterium]